MAPRVETAIVAAGLILTIGFTALSMKASERRIAKGKWIAEAQEASLKIGRCRSLMAELRASEFEPKTVGTRQAARRDYDLVQATREAAKGLHPILSTTRAQLKALASFESEFPEYLATVTAILAERDTNRRKSIASGVHHQEAYFRATADLDELQRLNEGTIRDRQAAWMQSAQKADALLLTTGMMLFCLTIGFAVSVRAQRAAQWRTFEAVRRSEAQLAITNQNLAIVNEKLAELASTDGLTGLTNHRTFMERLQQEMDKSKRLGGTLSVVLMDVDHFKAYNDDFGHLAGDEALRCVSRLLRAQCRSYDVIARYGGEEFALLLPQTDQAEAMFVAERIRSAISGCEHSLRQITVSVGVSSLCPRDTTTAEIVSRADRAMYASKSGGRNRVTEYSVAARALVTPRRYEIHPAPAERPA